MRIGPIVGASLGLFAMQVASEAKPAAAAALEQRAAPTVDAVLDEMLSRAPAAKAEIDALATAIAAQYGGRVALTAIKGRPRAIEKIMVDYGGDATRIKDLARNTIVIDERRIDAVVARLKTAGAIIKVIEHDENVLGYSGIVATLATRSNLVAEIQVHGPRMIVAAMSPRRARAVLGHARYDRIARAVGQPGGLGRAYYEEWRSLPAGSARAQAIAAKSRAYYSRFR